MPQTSRDVMYAIDFVIDAIFLIEVVIDLVTIHRNENGDIVDLSFNEMYFK
jgi:hypothetical protein